MENSNENNDRQRLVADEINQIRERLRTFNNGAPANDCWKLAFLQEEGEDILLNPDESVRSVAFASMTAEIAKTLSEQINRGKPEETFRTFEPGTAKFHLVDVAAVFDEGQQMRERWEKEKRVGRVSINDEFQTVCFHFDETTKKERYWFYLSQISDGESRMQWLNHLRHKRWFNREYFDDFMHVLEILGLIKQGL